MKASLLQIRHFQLPKTWLLFVAGSLIAIYLNLVWKSGFTNLLVTSTIFLTFIFWKINTKANILKIESFITSKICGILLIALAIYNSIVIPKYIFALRLFPLFSLLGLALLAYGVKGIKQYGQEIFLLSVLAVPLEALINPINKLFGVATLMAKFSTFILWYVGFDVSRQGDLIVLQSKAIWVGPNCSGILTMLWMLQIALLFVMIFPTKFIYRILVPVMAIAIAIAVNGIRIAIMSVIAAYNYQMFEYWHSDKAQIFSTIPLLLFALFCKFINQRSQAT